MPKARRSVPGKLHEAGDQADEAVLVERRVSIVPAAGDDLPGSGIVAHQPGEIEHAGLRTALVAGISKLAAQLRAEAGIDSQDRLRRLVAMAPDPIHHADEIRRRRI